MFMKIVEAIYFYYSLFKIFFFFFNFATDVKIPK